MRFHQLDLNLLVALDALLTERNITLAGRRLNLTQSAMSSSLSRLRTFFDDELLVLVGRKMVPTPLGESLVPRVRNVLVEIQSTIETKPVFDPATSTRRFTLMTSDYIATVLMTDVLRRAATLAPKVSFELIPNTVDSPSEFLDHAEIDFLVMPDNLLDDQHPKIRLFDEDYVCLAASDNSAFNSSITREQYLQTGHVVMQFSRHCISAVDRWLASQFGDARRIDVVVTSFNLLPQFIIGTQRIATIQRRMAQYYLRFGSLKLVETPFKAPPMLESLQWHSAFDQDPGNRWLRDLMIAVAQGDALRSTHRSNAQPEQSRLVAQS